MLLGYGAKVCLRKMRVKAENRMVTFPTSLLLVNHVSENDITHTIYPKFFLCHSIVSFKAT